MCRRSRKKRSRGDGEGMRGVAGVVECDTRWGEVEVTHAFDGAGGAGAGAERVEEVVDREGEGASEQLSEGWIVSDMVDDRLGSGIRVSDKGFKVVTWSRGRGYMRGAGGAEGAARRGPIVATSSSAC
jgi:hypothetical protein